jgi:hypothetical protein
MIEQAGFVAHEHSLSAVDLIPPDDFEDGHDPW